jgi:hypothetical protein
LKYFGFYNFHVLGMWQASQNRDIIAPIAPFTNHSLTHDHAKRQHGLTVRPAMGTQYHPSVLRLGVVGLWVAKIPSPNEVVDSGRVALKLTDHVRNGRGAPALPVVLAPA